MNSLFEPQNVLARATAKKVAQATPWQDEAVRAWESLGDAKQYLPRYLKLFKRANGMVHLWDLVDKARLQDNPGAYFLQSARNRLGIGKKSYPQGASLTGSMGR